MRASVVVVAAVATEAVPVAVWAARDATGEPIRRFAPRKNGSFAVPPRAAERAVVDRHDAVLVGLRRRARVGSFVALARRFRLTRRF